MDGFIEEFIIQDLLKPLDDGELSDADTDDSLSSNNSFCSDDEQARKRKQRRINNYVEEVVPTYSNDEFKAHFRITRKTVNKIIGLLKESPYLPTHKDGREKISAEKATLLTLWYCSNQEGFRQIADRFNVTMSTAHRSLKRVLKFLLSIKAVVIKWPTDAEANSIMEGFRLKKGIPNVIGAIDGSHIEIDKPANDQAAYINRKGYHSMLMQGIVDNNKKFLDVYCGEPGSIHDARLLRKSNIYAKFHSNPDLVGEKFVIGDTAYPNLHWLVTPYKDNGLLTNNHRDFNYRLSATRIVVEHAFGLLKGRFRRLRKLDNLDKTLCTEIIMGACVLHNICIDENDFIETDMNDFNQPAQEPHHNNLNVNDNEHQLNRQQQLFNLMYN